MQITNKRKKFLPMRMVLQVNASEKDNEDAIVTLDLGNPGRETI